MALNIPARSKLSVVCQARLWAPKMPRASPLAAWLQVCPLWTVGTLPLGV